jgi:hypothetical protein
MGIEFGTVERFQISMDHVFKMEEFDPLRYVAHDIPDLLAFHGRGPVLDEVGRGLEAIFPAINKLVQI